MASDPRNDQRRLFEEDYYLQNDPSVDLRQETALEQERRVRRQIANSNERRRMQCINAGFDNLRKLLPYDQGEKVSKATILQLATEYIVALRENCEKTKTLNKQLIRHLRKQGVTSTDLDVGGCPSSVPLCKRQKTDTESSDEGISLMDSATDGSSADEVKLQVEQMRLQLQYEQARRMVFENDARAMQQVFENNTCAPQKAQLVHTPRSLMVTPSPSVPHPVKMETGESCTVSSGMEVCVRKEQQSSESDVSPSVPAGYLHQLWEAIQQKEGHHVLGNITPHKDTDSSAQQREDRLLSDGIARHEEGNSPAQNKGDHSLSDDIVQQRESDSSADISVVVQHMEDEKEARTSDPESQSSESSGSPSLLRLNCSHWNLSPPTDPTPPPAHQGTVSKLPTSTHLHQHPYPFTPKSRRLRE